MIVEKRNGQVCFTHGWGDLSEIYGLKHGAAVSLINVHPYAKFVIPIKYRYGEEVTYPSPDTPFCIKLNRYMFPELMSKEFVFQTPSLPYSHEVGYFRYSPAKFLTKMMYIWDIWDVFFFFFFF